MHILASRIRNLLPPALLVASCVLAGLAEQPSRPASGERFRPAQKRYWLFQPVMAPSVPSASSAGAAAHPVDAFLQARLAEKELTLAPEADKITLLRRAYFDLIGMPPGPEEVDAFLADRSPNAYERMIDRLLASPHYGERWGRHWLDLARYAESDGFRADDIRPTAWRYRDFVIRSFNEDKPYDRFVQEQIAGDEMFPGNMDAKLATAFNRQYPDEYNAQNLRARRQEILNDITDTVGAVFLGLTFECARCHDHKFDPILQEDYYRLQAFFSNVSADDEFALLAPEAHAEYQRKLALWKEKTADIRKQMEALVADRVEKSRKSRYTAYVEEVKVALDKPPAERTPIERWMADKAKYFMNPDPAALAVALKGEARQKYEELQKQLDAFAHLHPGELPKGTGITELTSEIIPTHVLSAGAYDKPLAPVEPGFLTILDPRPAVIEPSVGGTTGRRTALAKWLTDPRNPIVARVMVNRVWHHHFGRGIVASTSDFGIMGARPSHPQLLDWLAAEFVNSGWRLKHLHRLIMTSRAYRQSSAFRADAAAKDPENLLLWRYDRKRLEGEAIRDAALSVSGLLNPVLFGPSVLPPVPAGVPASQWTTSPDTASHYRRSIYTFVRRNTPYPMLEVFDQPDTHLTCGRRGVTVTAPQALTYLNSSQALDWARGFAARVIATAGPEPPRQVETAYRLAFSRPPRGEEKDAALTFLSQHQDAVREQEAKGGKLLAPPNLPSTMTPVAAAALVDFCHALLNASEFIYVN
jgi:hypothetical protein